MIYAEVEIPSLRRSYDFKLDENTKIDDLIDEMCVIVCQKEKGEVLVRKNDMILALVTKGIIMNNIYTLSDYNAFDGTKLMLI
jgi:uncharacterized ubiquitin-like protein YukD